MGGTGNTGAEPEKQAGVQAGLAAGGDPAMPQWGAGAAAPGEVAAQGGLPALTEAPPTLRPYEEATASTGTGAGPQTGLLAPSSAGPMGFSSNPYPTRSAAVETFAAAAPPPAAAAASGPFAAPTSFRPIWDVASEVNDQLSRKYAGNQQVGWQNDPTMAQEWLQLIADKGGDWRDSTTGMKPGYGYGYNIAAPGGMGQVYWPGDPARPK
jgi:hypothetical protein